MNVTRNLTLFLNLFEAVRRWKVWQPFLYHLLLYHTFLVKSTNF